MTERRAPYSFTLPAITIEMPYERDLSINHMYAQGRGGRRFLKPHVRAWRRMLAWQCRRYYHQVQQVMPCNLIVGWTVYAPDDWRVRDADNYAKAIFDGIRDGFDVDDSRFRIGDVPTVEPSSEPRIVVRVQIERIEAA